jgi:hypothetical protein
MGLDATFLAGRFEQSTALHGPGKRRPDEC